MRSLYVPTVEFLADLHIHSYLSRATAKNLNLENLNLWAQLKGITVVGTGDFTHPQWFSELTEKLEPMEEGLFALKQEYAAATAPQVPTGCRGDVRFILSVEISSIYKKGGNTRKVHNLVLVPTLNDAKRLNEKLARIGNIGSDGRPILGLDSRVLLEMVLETTPEAIFIPAHIWTPWFSVLGSKSGFDSLDACFDDLVGEIFAVETGLSSDPAMNWRVSSLDRFTLVSNSDAHSPANLGREANLFNTEMTYHDMREALKKGDPGLFLGTIEYFAEEGKYHLDGHRKCGIRLEPKETQKKNGLCPVCQKPMTIGVMHRVQELADRDRGSKPENKPGYTSLLPLTDVLSEILQVGPKSKKVGLAYRDLLEKVGPEFHILRHASSDALERHGPALLAEGMRRMREGKVTIAPGFDGEFGTISLFSESERLSLLGQKRLFPATGEKREHRQGALFGERHGGGKEVFGDLGNAAEERTVYGDPPPSKTTSRRAMGTHSKDKMETPKSSGLLEDLNTAQRAAAQHVGGPLMIVAGPGTGKTRTLTYRIAYLIREYAAAPEQVLAVTFTNKAAAEMTRRLETLLKDRSISKHLTIRTFHGLCMDILTQEAETLGIETPIQVLGEADRLDCVKKALKQVLGSQKGNKKALDAISLAKQGLLGPDDDLAPFFQPPGPVISSDLRASISTIYGKYEEILSRLDVFDFDDLILQVVRLFEQDPSLCRKYRERFAFISVDEYQDVNYGQYRLICMLAKQPHDLCVIGDPAQAIYGFRGADVRYFKRFHEDYPGAEWIRLRQNYRSTETILKASAQVLYAEEDIFGEKEVWSGIEGLRALTVAELSTEEREADYVVQSIESAVGGTSHFSLDAGRVCGLPTETARGFSDFAVLYRTKEQAGVLESAFERSGIPYQGQGSRRVEDQPGIRLVLSLLKMVWKISTNLDAERVLASSLTGLDRRSIEGLKRWANKTGMGPIDLIRGGCDVSQMAGGSAAKIMDMREHMRRARERVDKRDVSDQIGMIPELFPLSETVSEPVSFQQGMAALQDMARPFGRDSRRFLTQLALQGEQDRYSGAAEKVALMTMHASKGLEFPVVFIVGCEDGLVPYQNTEQTSDLREEGRLFYVALTRAKEEVILSHVKKRRRFGKTENQRISPFIGAIDKGLKDHVCPGVRRPSRPKCPSQLSLFSL